MKLITNEDIAKLGITPDKCNTWVTDAFMMKDICQLPVKSSVHPQGSDFFTSMPCLLPSHRYGVKIVRRIESNNPKLKSDLLLYDSYNGNLLCMMEADWITSMRTGAVAAVTAKYIRNGTNYAMVGLGNIAVATLKCILSETDKVFRIKLLRYKNQAEELIEEFSGYDNVEFSIVDSFEELVNNTDVLISCISSAKGEFLPDDKYPEGISVLAVHTRGFENCDTTFDIVIGDDTNHISNFKNFNQYHKFVETKDIINGSISINPSDRKLVYNYGIAVHDVLFASRIYDLINDHKA